MADILRTRANPYMCAHWQQSNEHEQLLGVLQIMPANLGTQLIPIAADELSLLAVPTRTLLTNILLGYQVSLLISLSSYSYYVMIPIFTFSLKPILPFLPHSYHILTSDSFFWLLCYGNIGQNRLIIRNTKQWGSYKHVTYHKWWHTWSNLENKTSLPPQNRHRKALWNFRNYFECEL